MKKFLEFIWEVISPVVLFVVAIVLGILALTWIFTGFGILIILDPTDFPTPIWVNWFVGIFDIFCLVIILYGAIKEAYKKVYKN
jgi:hypothetical protein